MTHTKTEWRALLLKARAALDEAARRRHSSAIVQRLAALPELEASQTVVLYEALGAEVDLQGLSVSLAARGKAIYLPSDGRSPTWVEHPVASARNGTQRVVFPARPVLVVVPAVGFDRYGTRLGRGRGHYDRALAELRKIGPIFAAGVAFEIQLVPRLPRDIWDQSVDLVVTERQLIVPVSRPEEACEQ